MQITSSDRYIHVCNFYIFNRFGPLRQHWTMHFEAKHSYFKKITQSVGNFINLPYTLAMRHQKLQCYHRMNNFEYHSGTLDVGPGEYIISHLLSFSPHSSR